MLSAFIAISYLPVRLLRLGFSPKFWPMTFVFRAAGPIATGP
jgi:tellurite resistance protein TehA-like permease